MTRADELRKTIADAQAELDALEQPVDSWRTADDWNNRVEVRKNCNDGITITARREDGSYMSPLSTHDATAMALRMLELCGVNLYQPVIDRLREISKQAWGDGAFHCPHQAMLTRLITELTESYHASVQADTPGSDPRAKCDDLISRADVIRKLAEIRQTRLLKIGHASDADIYLFNSISRLIRELESQEVQ